MAGACRGPGAPGIDQCGVAGPQHYPVTILAIFSNSLKLTDDNTAAIPRIRIHRRVFGERDRSRRKLSNLERTNGTTIDHTAEKTLSGKLETAVATDEGCLRPPSFQPVRCWNQVRGEQLWHLGHPGWNLAAHTFLFLRKVPIPYSGQRYHKCRLLTMRHKLRVAQTSENMGHAAIGSATCLALTTDPAVAEFCPAGLPAGNSPDNKERLLSACHGLGKRSIRRFVRQVLLASKETQKGPTLEGRVVANRSPQHRIVSLEGIQQRSLCHGALNLELHLETDVR